MRHESRKGRESESKEGRIFWHRRQMTLHFPHFFKMTHMDKEHSSFSSLLLWRCEDTRSSRRSFKNLRDCHKTSFLHFLKSVLCRLQREIQTDCDCRTFYCSDSHFCVYDISSSWTSLSLSSSYECCLQRFQFPRNGGCVLFSSAKKREFETDTPWIVIHNQRNQQKSQCETKWRTITTGQRVVCHPALHDVHQSRCVLYSFRQLLLTLFELSSCRLPLVISLLWIVCSITCLLGCLLIMSSMRGDSSLNCKTELQDLPLLCFHLLY